ncbi:MAG: hypothetical protein IPK07_29900 [Deltaproteobacteria bacterium]|nr:hypothetical protein [Deltaproteobacteria bacterium]
MTDPAAPLGPLADLRARVTARTASFLGEGRACVVVGGPATGKTRMLRELARRVPELLAIDDASPAELAEALAGNRRPLVVSLDALSYEEARGLAQGHAFVPLVNVPRPWVREIAPDGVDQRWDVSLGHPALAAAHGSGALGTVRRQLREAWRKLLEERFEEEVLLTELRKLGPMAPSERYQRLHAVHGNALKHHLDWLACAGMVTRLLDEESAGVTAVPV